MPRERRPTLLWIDDDCHAWVAVKEAFEARFETVAAESFFQAQQFWDEVRFDCVVVDLYLPYRANEVAIERYVGLTALRKILERHGDGVVVAAVLSVTIPEHVEAELEKLRARWHQVRFRASSKLEVVVEGLDTFADWLAATVNGAEAPAQ